MTGSSPLQVTVTDLRRRSGSRRRVHLEVELDGLAISTASVPENGCIDVDVELESMGNSIVATGKVSAPWSGVCRRCLGQVDDVLHATVREIFEVAPTEGETYQLGHDTVDLEPMVRDVVMLALPLAPLCAYGCAGPAPDEFPTGPEPTDETPSTDGARDPRWAALDQITFGD